jgi:c-di-GMP-binding flagellar brake protein YcgR
MEERRRHKRLDLDVSVELERLDTEGTTTLKFVHVDVTDLSKLGIGFQCDKQLEIGSFYDVRLTIWTKEIISSVIEIVRCVPSEDGAKYQYGCRFVGLSETDALKIEIYQIFDELQKDGTKRD